MTIKVCHKSTQLTNHHLWDQSAMFQWDNPEEILDAKV